MLDYVLHSVLAIGFITCAVSLIPGLLYLAASIGTILVVAHAVKHLTQLLRALLPRRRVLSYNKAVVVTGCDSGFGHLLAERLDSDGFQVFAGCLFPSGEGAVKLKTSCSPRLQVLKLDVTKEEDVLNAVNTVKEELGIRKLWAVVNNAGVGTAAEIEWQNIDNLRSMFEVNTFGMVRVTQAFLPLLRRSKGRVVNTNSMAGRIPATKLVGYSMAKAATVFFTRGLHVEMMRWGVKACSIEPFVYKTPLVEVNLQEKSVNHEWKLASDEVKEDYGDDYLESFRKCFIEFHSYGSDKIYQVVDAMMDAITAKEPLPSYIVGPLQFRFGFWFLSIFPRSFFELFQHMTGPSGIPNLLRNKKMLKSQ